MVTAKIYIIDRFNPKDTITKITQDIYRVGKFKVDFSGGVGFNTILDPSFYIGKNDTIPFIGIEEARDFDFNLFFLAHFNWRVASYLSIGPSTGISVSAFSAKPSYILGISTSIGRRNLVSINGGLAIGQRNVLSRSISTNGMDVDLPLDPAIESVPTYSKIGTGGYFSITYNFKRIKTKIK